MLANQFIDMSGLMNIITLSALPGASEGSPTSPRAPASVEYLDMSRTLMSLKPEKQVQVEGSHARVVSKKMIKPHSQVHLLSSIEKCKVRENSTVSLDFIDMYI